MPFGQQSGPPASARQLQDLLALVRGAGYLDFRDARHPLDLTQRQAGGRFTREEAAELIERLETGAATEPAAATPAGETPTSDRSPRVAAASQMLRHLPAEQLATELERRGWIVIAP